jgi:hypothetical protein
VLGVKLQAIKFISRRIIMIDVQAIFNEALNQKKQDTVCVDSVEYKINTHFTPWLMFAKEYNNYKSGKNNDIKSFDFIYKTKRDNEGNWIGDVPKNREDGLKELIKFYNEPFDGKNGNKRIINCASLEIFKPMKELFDIDIPMDNLHFHKFVKIVLLLVENGIIEDNSKWLVDE